MNTPAPTAPIERHLLPDSAETDSSGQLTIGGVRLTDLAEQHGTPLFVYDEDHLRSRCAEAVEAFGPEVAYASKAFLCKEMARVAADEGMRIDVASGGEMHVALEAGVPADRLVFHGNNKSTAELNTALDVGIGLIVLDSFDEIDRIEALVATGSRRANVMIRVTPGVEAHTHEFVQTGQEDSKFGFGWKSGAAHEAVERAKESAALNLVGLHIHIGSQVFSVANFAQALEVVAPLAVELDLPEFCVGGGLGVAYVAGEEAPTITQWANAIREVCTRVGIKSSISAEPGRAIAAQAGVTLYEAGTIKDLPGIRTYVSVDGGMSDNPRPVLYGSGYETFLPRDVDANRTKQIRLVGKHCESGDLLVREGNLPEDLKIGDIVCTPVTGAYGHSMGSNYNKVPRPTVVFVSKGTARVVVRRETFDDLMARDL